MKSKALQAIEDGMARGRLLNDRTRQMLILVAEERSRQEALAGKKFPHTCASAEMLHAERLVVLIEEVGEVAEALQRPGRFADLWRQHLRQELIQVAAVAVAWAESLSGSAAVSQTSRSNVEEQ